MFVKKLTDDPSKKYTRICLFIPEKDKH